MHRGWYDRKIRLIRYLSCGDTHFYLEIEFRRVVLAKAGTPEPEAIGIDEISIRKRHAYRIVVSDLIRGRPIWFGGKERSEASMQEFFKWLGPKKTKPAVMDIWKPLRKVTEAQAPQSAILYVRQVSCDKAS